MQELIVKDNEQCY